MGHPDVGVDQTWGTQTWVFDQAVQHSSFFGHVALSNFLDHAVSSGFFDLVGCLNSFFDLDVLDSLDDAWDLNRFVCKILVSYSSELSSGLDTVVNPKLRV